MSGRETAGGAKRTVSAAGYAAGHLGNVPPVYPYRARRKEIEGRVVLRVRVLPGGTARSVEVLSSSGHAILDRAALKAVRAWRFVPAKRSGVPVGGAIDVPITFRLTD
ncbi:MAG: energy transducer TonB [Alphaproteobacteria bacterium]